MKTGSTDLRDTEVQQPKTTETLSLAISSRAFSAKSGQLEAGSTTTASSFLPRTPPFLFCSSIMNRMVSLSVVSEIAMVPESECRTPTLMVSAALADEAKAPAEMAAPTIAPRSFSFTVMNISPGMEPCSDHGARRRVRSGRELNAPQQNGPYVI